MCAHSAELSTDVNLREREWESETEREREKERELYTCVSSTINSILAFL